MTVNIEERRKSIIRYLDDNAEGYYMVSDIAEILNLTNDVARKDLHYLLDKGKVRKFRIEVDYLGNRKCDHYSSIHFEKEEVSDMEIRNNHPEIDDFEKEFSHANSETRTKTIKRRNDILAYLETKSPTLVSVRQVATSLNLPKDIVRADLFRLWKERADVSRTTHLEQETNQNVLFYTFEGNTEEIKEEQKADAKLLEVILEENHLNELMKEFNIQTIKELFEFLPLQTLKHIQQAMFEIKKEVKEKERLIG